MHSYGRDSCVYESSLRNVISLNGLVIILSLTHTQLDAYDLLGPPEQLLSRKKKVQTFLVYQLSQTKLLAVNTCIFSVNCQILFLWDSQSHIVYLTQNLYAQSILSINKCVKNIYKCCCCCWARSFMSISFSIAEVGPQVR